MKFLIAGLGNIGSEYDYTRHNIGFEVLDRFAARHSASFSGEKLGAVARLRTKGRTYVLLKPNTYMNLSGKAIQYWLQAEKIQPDHLLVITDDLALPLGKIRIRPKGSDGGHNGLKSIIEVLGHENWPRLRFGVGNEFAKGKQVDYVLGKWKPEEEEILNLRINRAMDSIEAFGSIGLERAMNLYNG